MKCALYRGSIGNTGIVSLLFFVPTLYGNGNDFSRRYGANGYLTNMPLYYEEAASHHHITPPHDSTPSAETLEKRRIAQEKQDAAQQLREDAKYMTPEERSEMRKTARKAKTPACPAKIKPKKQKTQTSPTLTSQVPEPPKKKRTPTNHSPAHTVEKTHTTQDNKVLDAAQQLREDAKHMTPEERLEMRKKIRKAKTPACCGKSKPKKQKAQTSPMLMSQAPESPEKQILHTEYPRTERLNGHKRVHQQK